MPSTRFLSWRTIREIAVVVLSILIAFGLDAWWDRATRRQELEDQLPVVIQELNGTRAALDLALQAHGRQGDLARGLSAALRQAEDPQRVVVSDTLVGPLFPQFTMDVSTASLESFIGAGGLELVHDRSARARLREWPTRMDDARDDETFLRNFPAAQLALHLRMNFDVAQAELMGGRWLQASTAGGGGDDEGLALAPGRVTLRMDTALLNLLAARESHEVAMVRTLTPLRQESEELIRTLGTVR